MFKKVIAYIVCIFVAPKAVAEAINSAAAPDDLDEKICLLAGVDYGRKKKNADRASFEDFA